MKDPPPPPTHTHTHTTTTTTTTTKKKKKKKKKERKMWHAAECQHCYSCIDRNRETGRKTDRQPGTEMEELDISTYMSKTHKDTNIHSRAPATKTRQAHTHTHKHTNTNHLFSYALSFFTMEKEIKDFSRHTYTERVSAARIFNDALTSEGMNR